MFPRSSSELAAVLASVLMASVACHVALDQVRRAHGHETRQVRAWWRAGAVILGTSIWASHFVGMLALSLAIQLGGAKLLTAVSWVAAVAVSAVALGLASRGRLTTGRWAKGSLAMGAGICAMHFIGMTALDRPAPTLWNPSLILASSVIAVAASAAALKTFFRLACALELREVAERVETQVQRDIVPDDFCDEHQGCRFTESMPADDSLAGRFRHTVAANEPKVKHPERALVLVD